MTTRTDQRAHRLLLADTASLYFRAFYGVPDSVRSPDGAPVNAVRGLLDFLTRLVEEYRPTHLACCWDNDWRPQWRVDLLPTYKAHRVAHENTAANAAQTAWVEEVPDPLEAQIPVIIEVLAAVGLAVVGVDDHEADDVIGTLATGAGMPVDVVTGDRDLFQLVDDENRVRVLYTARGVSRHERITDEVVVEKYGVLPCQYADFATLRGDASDGLPGVAGVGAKTAAALLLKYGDLAGIRRAAADPSSQMSPTPRRRINEAAEYLDVAPRVVAVVRDLDLGTPDLAVPSTPARPTQLIRLRDRWGLGGSVDRLTAALGAGEPGTAGTGRLR